MRFLPARLTPARSLTGALSGASCLLLAGLLACVAPAGATPGGASAGPVVKSDASATLLECVSAPSGEGRSVTFAGEMIATPATAKMEMRVDVLERAPSEPLFHTVSARGLGVWRGSAPGVKVYRYLKQVANLTAPATYRAAVRFRWLNARGRVIRVEDLRTAPCHQSAPPATTPPTPAPTPPTTTTTTGTSTGSSASSSSTSTGGSASTASLE